MKAMVLCAGLGTRLRPLTDTWPKPAIPLLGIPLFEYTLAGLYRAGVRHVGINTHHLPDVMARVAKAACERRGVSLEVSHEPVIQGTGGGIRGLRAFLADDAFIVTNGDILYPLDFAQALAQHHAGGAAASMVLLPMPAGETYAAVECDADMQVRRVAGHGPGGGTLSPWHFTGVHILSPVVFDFMRAGGPEDINRDVYVRMLGAGQRVSGIVMPEYWSDLGTPKRYLATQTALLTGQVDLLKKLGLSAQSPVAPGAVIEPGAQVGPRVYVGKGARICRGARVVDAAVLDNTTIASGEVCERVIAWGEHRLRA
ncbi:MAG: sugar phosphate nucleotidyltransferase [Myxococcaceae bacterium]